MPALGRTQLIVYAAVAVAILLLGARWIGGAGAGPTATQFGGPPPAGAAEVATAEPGGGLEVESPGGGGLTVHVAGAVRRPGVYRFAAGARVTDAIERAGGAKPGAVTDAINLAAALADGQQVVVPDRSAATGTAGLSPGATEAAPISLGGATAEQLDTIEGIGPVTAAAILEFRDSQGGVSSIDELDQISGIGPATMDALRARLQP